MSTHHTAADNPPVPKESLLLLAAGTASLLVLQYRTLPKFSMLPAVFPSFDQFRIRVAEVVHLTGEDLLWFALPMLCFAALMVREWQQSSVTKLLHWVFVSNRRTWIGLLVLTAVWVRFYWALGEGRWVGDAGAHIAYAIAASNAIKSLEFPIWTNLLGVGAPYLQYYGFLYFYLVGILEFFIRDIFASIKVSLWLGHTISAAAMYLFAREVLQSRAAAFVAALAYVASFWHIQQTLLMGRFPVSLFYALLPLPFYVFERVLRGDHRPSTLGLGGILLGAIPMVHPGYGFWATGFFGIYAILRLLTEPTSHPRAIRSFMAMTLLGLAFGAYITLGMLLERGGTILESGVLLSDVPDPSWKRIFLWSNLLFSVAPLHGEELMWYGGYLGTSLLVLAAVGAVLNSRFTRTRKMNGMPVFVCLALAFLLVFGYRLSLLQASSWIGP